jgi:hypothetical protein
MYAGPSTRTVWIFVVTEMVDVVTDWDWSIGPLEREAMRPLLDPFAYVNSDIPVGVSLLGRVDARLKHQRL